MSTVYIANTSRSFDFSSAEQYGQLVPVSSGTANIHNPQSDLEAMRRTLAAFSAEDYLLLAGNAISNVVAVLALLFLLPEEVPIVRLLFWDAKHDAYKAQRYDRQHGMFL